MKPKALYIHIPFCDHICIYCDFYKMIAKEKEIEKYLNYLIKELDLYQQYFESIETIYIGGGTPSSVNVNLLDSFLGEVSSRIDFSKIIEYTIEANPKDITDEFIALLNKHHINRISLGVQSLNNDKLSFLHRNHTEKDALESIKKLKEINFPNISCDLIYGLSTDTYDLIENDLNKLCELNINHISCYSLIIEDKTILNNMITKYHYKPLSNDKQADLYDFINKFLNKKGYVHYEISNYSIDGFQSKHNLIYWNNENYLGIGANASYYIDNTRYTNINNLPKYYAALDNLKPLRTEINQLSKNDIIYEEIMLGLRKCQGINIDKFKEKFNLNILIEFPNIEWLIKYDLLNLVNNYLFIPEKNLFVMNEILLKIFERTNQ